MSARPLTRLSLLCAAALVAVAFFSAAAGAQGEAPSGAHARLSIRSSDHPVFARLVDALTRASVLAGSHAGIRIPADVSGHASDDSATARAWGIALDGEPPNEWSRIEPSDDLPAGFLLDLDVDLATLRRDSPQPFSRTARGRVLEALGIANARRVRYAAVADTEDDDRLLLICATESRAQQPGMWRAYRVARVSIARLRGDVQRVAPTRLDFDELWAPAVRAAAAVILAEHDEHGARSVGERITDWGAPRAAALRGFAAALEPTLWAWPGGSDDALVVAARIARGSSDQAIASHLRTMLGRRVEWGRGEDNRATGTVAIQREARPASADTPRLFIRFISIDRRAYLVCATREEDLDAAPATLATLAD